MTRWLQLSIRLSSLECLRVSRFFAFGSCLSLSLSLSLSLFSLSFSLLCLHTVRNRPLFANSTPLSLVFVHFGSYSHVARQNEPATNIRPTSFHAWILLLEDDSSEWSTAWENFDAGRRIRWLSLSLCLSLCLTRARVLRGNSSHCQEARVWWRRRLWYARVLPVRHREWKWNASRRKELEVVVDAM